MGTAVAVGVGVGEGVCVGWNVGVAVGVAVRVAVAEMGKEAIFCVSTGRIVGVAARGGGVGSDFRHPVTRRRRTSRNAMFFVSTDIIPFIKS
jgi:hypothetical protein